MESSLCWSILLHSCPSLSVQCILHRDVLTVWNAICETSVWFICGIDCTVLLGMTLFVLCIKTDSLRIRRWKWYWWAGWHFDCSPWAHLPPISSFQPVRRERVQCSTRNWDVGAGTVCLYSLCLIITLCFLSVLFLSDYGELGVGNTVDFHEPPQDAIDLGTDFPVESAYGGLSHTCAKSTYGTTKCLVNIPTIDIIYPFFLCHFLLWDCIHSVLLRFWKEHWGPIGTGPHQYYWWRRGWNGWLLICDELGHRFRSGSTDLRCLCTCPLFVCPLNHIDTEHAIYHCPTMISIHAPYRQQVQCVSRCSVYLIIHLLMCPVYWRRDEMCGT